jgi:alpha-L-fucosidase
MAPAESDTPLHKGHWFWHPNDESTLKTLDDLVTTYEKTIGRGSQLMLGLAPDQRGLLPEADVKRLEEFGYAIRQRYGQNLMTKHLRTQENVEAALDGDPSTFWSSPAGSHHARLEASFARPIIFDCALTMEWLNDGQHVEHYRIEAWDGSHWKAVVEGHAIGHKRIDTFAPVTASRIRLNILSSSDAAEIREFQIFNVGSDQKRNQKMKRRGGCRAPSGVPPQS